MLVFHVLYIDMELDATISHYIYKTWCQVPLRKSCTIYAYHSYAESITPFLHKAAYLPHVPDKRLAFYSC